MAAGSTGLVGRSSDVRAILASLTQSRLVTLTGPGGVGKTRLAREIEKELETEFDRIVFVDLTVEGSARDAVLPQDVVALDLSTTLLVLDNCEHLIDEVAATVDEVLGATKNTRILATSRRPLHVAGERLHAVGPLSTPEFCEPISDLVTYEAVQLFLQRSAELDSSFSLTVANAEAVKEVCRLSNGLPVAIELAAGLTRSRPLDAIASAMAGNHAPDLKVPRRDFHFHQQSLSRSVGWSVELLEPDAQLALQCAAVFRGSFTPAAVDLVHQRAGGKRTALLMDQLVEHSLASLNPESNRFTILGIVAHAVRAMTDPETSRTLEAAHTMWALDTSCAISAAATEPDPGHTFPGFKHNLTDLTCAADRLAASNDLQQWRELVGPIAEWWVHHGGTVDRQTWERALGDEPCDDAQRVGLANGLAFHLSHLGDYFASRRIARRAHAGALAVGRPDMAVAALIVIGNALLAEGDPDGAQEAYYEANTLELDRANPYLSAIVAFCLSRTVAEGPAQRELLAQALAIAGPDYPAINIMAQQELARCALADGDLETASSMAASGVRAADVLGFPEAEGTAYNTLGSIAIARSDYAEAQQAHRSAITIGQRIGHIGLVADGLVGIALILTIHGATDQGRQLARLAVELSPPVNMPTELLPVIKAGGEPPRAEDLQSLLEASRGRLELRELERDASTILTARETSVLLLLRGDLTQREIADELYVSPSTVRTHVKAIYRKLGVHNRTSCVHHATVLSLLPAP